MRTKETFGDFYTSFSKYTVVHGLDKGCEEKMLQEVLHLAEVKWFELIKFAIDASMSIEEFSASLNEAIEKAIKEDEKNGSN